MTQATFINLLPHEYTQGLHNCLFVVNVDRCVSRCHTLNDPFNKVYVLRKIDDLNLSVFNMIA